MTDSTGAMVREARRRAGLSQSELARRAGITQPVVSAYENDRREPSVRALRRLIEAAGQHLLIEVASDPPRPAKLPGTVLGRLLAEHGRRIIALAEQRGMSNVRVFGSVARGEDGEHSDVDLLVDTDGNVSVIDLVGFERAVRELIGRDVDVVPADSLKGRIAPTVSAEVIPL